MTTTDAAHLFEIASHPARLVLLLTLAAEGPTPFGALVERLGCTRPMASLHVAYLRVAGLVEGVRSGTRRVYDLTPAGRALAAAVTPLFRD